MSQLANSNRLVKQVAGRKRAISFAQSFYLFTLIAAGIYAVLLLLNRLLSLIPDFFDLWTVATVPAIGLIVALIVHRRPKLEDAARDIDKSVSTKDLFLTALLIEKSPGEYKPLVVEAAESRAPQVRPVTVVPYTPWKKTANLVTAVAILLGCVLLPQFDPFEVQKERQVRDKQKQRLKKQVKLATMRKAALKKKDVNAELSKEVEDALSKLKQTLRQMKPRDQQGNQQKLQQKMDQLKDMWQKAGQKKLAQELSKAGKRFGAPMNTKTAQWKKDINSGDTSSMEKELQDLKEKVKELMSTKDEKKKQQLQNQIKQQMQQLSQFAEGNLNSQPLSQAMQQALQQLNQSNIQGMQQQSLQALQQQLQLAQMEMQNSGQMIRDLKSLNHALRTVQQASQLNQSQSLDGKQCGSCQSLGDYQKVYNQQMAKQGQGQGGQGGNKPGQGQGQGQGGNKSGQGQGQGQGAGQGGKSQGQPTARGGGMGGPGQGRGGIAPEDNSKTAFKTELAKSALVAGKTLLKWKTNEAPPTGEARKQFLDSVKRVKQGASEAILNEQIPPGYHDFIKNYFKTLDGKPDGGDQSGSGTSGADGGGNDNSSQNP